MKNKEIWLNDATLGTEEKAAIVAYCIANRLQNYGYDYKSFRNLSNQASRCRKALKERAFGEGLNSLNWEALNVRRFYWYQGETGPRTLHYCTGQSQNEEIIRVMQVLLSKPRTR